MHPPARSCWRGVAPRLVAYYVEGARRFRTWVRPDAWPLSPNGKMDRAALPQPDSVQIAQDEYEALTTPTAVARTKIFEEVLRMDPVANRAGIKISAQRNRRTGSKTALH